MTTTDWIQFWLAISNSVLAIISIIAIVITIVQNKIIIDNSKRAFVIIYKDLITINSSIEYLIIKNSGNTTAHIINIDYNQDDIDLLSKYKLNEALKNLNNCYLAPNQSFKLPFCSRDVDLETISFKVEYLSGKRKFNEQFIINIQQDHGIVSAKQTLPHNELKEISNSLQELVKRIN